MGGVAKELGLVEQTLRNWVKAAAKGTPNGVGSRMVTPEERELSRLRAENRRLKRGLELGCVKKIMLGVRDYWLSSTARGVEHGSLVLPCGRAI